MHTDKNCEYNQSKLYAILIGIIICALFTIVMSSHYIYLFSKEPIAVIGRLDTVSFHRKGIEIDMDGDPYILYQPRNAVLTYGFKDGIRREKMYTFLNRQKGKEVYLEYIKIAPTHKNVVSLTIDGVDYVNKNEAISDSVEVNKNARYIATALLILMIPFVFLAHKGKIQLEK